MIGSRFYCPTDASVLCDKGPGKPPRKKCSYCGSTLRSARGLWGVFTWNAEGIYHGKDAHSTYAAHGTAQAVASRSNKVVRFIPEAPR